MITLAYYISTGTFKTSCTFLIWNCYYFIISMMTYRYHWWIWDCIIFANFILIWISVICVNLFLVQFCKRVFTTFEYVIVKKINTTVSGNYKSSLFKYFVLNKFVLVRREISIFFSKSFGVQKNVNTTITYRIYNFILSSKSNDLLTGIENSSKFSLNCFSETLFVTHWISNNQWVVLWSRTHFQ